MTDDTRNKKYSTSAQVPMNLSHDEDVRLRSSLMIAATMPALESALGAARQEVMDLEQQIRFVKSEAFIARVLAARTALRSEEGDTASE